MIYSEYNDSFSEEFEFLFLVSPNVKNVFNEFMNQKYNC